MYPGAPGWKPSDSSAPAPAPAAPAPAPAAPAPAPAPAPASGWNSMFSTSSVTSSTYGAAPAEIYNPSPSGAPTPPSYGDMSSAYANVTPSGSGAPPSIPGFGPPPHAVNTSTIAAPAAPPPASWSQPPAAPPPSWGAPPATAAAPPPAWGAPPATATAPPPAWGAPPAPTPKRKALLIGCSYPGTSSQLSGCINDVQCMEFGLKKHYGFNDSEILVLRDDGYARSPDFVSTRANILRAIQWLTSDLSPGTNLVFHFSGHGGQQRSRGRDEADGMDETLMPTDFSRAGPIVDNDLNAMLVQPLPHGVILHAIVDACHSGTAFDLPFETTYDYYRQMYVWKQNVGGYTRGGLALQIGACLDQQTAQDTNRNTGGKVFTGAATYAFLQAIEANGPRQAYGALISNMANQLVSKSQGQFPVLTCSQALDLNTPLLI